MGRPQDLTQAQGLALSTPGHAGDAQRLPGPEVISPQTTNGFLLRETWSVQRNPRWASEGGRGWPKQRTRVLRIQGQGVLRQGQKNPSARKLTGEAEVLQESSCASCPLEGRALQTRVCSRGQNKEQQLGPPRPPGPPVPLMEQEDLCLGPGARPHVTTPVTLASTCTGRNPMVMSALPGQERGPLYLGGGPPSHRLWARLHCGLCPQVAWHHPSSLLVPSLSRWLQVQKPDSQTRLA